MSFDDKKSRSLTPVFERPAVAFFGRSLAEYVQFFDLDVDALRGRSVLDVAAGPSSFTAEARRGGVEAVAVDPLYARNPADLERQVAQDYEHMFERMRTGQNSGRFRFKSFASVDEAEADRRRAAKRFLGDFAAHREHGRYFGAALPKLPFLDGAFDVVLCAHLLFIYPALFDFAFHLAACRELMRVARDEVRIHPVCGADGQPYPQLGDLIGELGESGVEAREVPVDYEFFAGATTMLVLRPG
ncbi:methyltransferase [Actomonas aquatica]|uniref:Methyltransferase n=1 Tax=Actomonas aquatica TaxID=2866162 RepID=A0ABZ1CFQ3_9BACT|nr:methyltransferase [Opitutus sp. WL0086]WRQ90053.1 methyltransferase [Opitutus sp. WL0086]